MISWVALDRMVEEKAETDAEYRERVADRPRRSQAKRLTDLELLAKLRSFGVDLDRSSLERLCDESLSAEEIARPLIAKRAFQTRQEKLEGDWIWVYLDALWQRWFPEKPSFEMLDDKIQAGYEVRASGNQDAACRIWLEAWNDVLHLADKAGVQSIGEFDDRFGGTQCLFNWIQGSAAVNSGDSADKTIFQNDSRSGSSHITRSVEHFVADCGHCRKQRQAGIVCSSIAPDAQGAQGNRAHPTGQPPRIRFVPTTAAATPAAMNDLCLAYRHVLAQGLAHPLVAIAALVLDSLCIHPFRDGNGRVSRLLTLLALYQNGYEVGRYIGLERLVEEAKDDYYESLRRSSEGWHEGQNDLLPWLNCFLSVLRRAYRELGKHADGLKSPRGAKTALVEDAINSFAGEFTLEDLKRACPDVSQDLVRKVLRDLKGLGKVVPLGRGPGATWKKSGNTPKRG